MSETTPTTLDHPTTSPIRFRRKRIAVSVVFGLLTLLLVVMWVRSYYCSDRLELFGTGKTVSYSIDSINSSLHFQICEVYVESAESWTWWYFTDDVGGLLLDRRWFGKWYLFTDEHRIQIATPHWFWVLVAAFHCSMVWGILRFSWQFSVRAMLIATTLVAVVLDAVVWAAAG